MKDSLYLLLTGFIAAGLGWLFWHYAGENGYYVMSLLVVFLTTADNVRLRRRLREMQVH